MNGQSSQPFGSIFVGMIVQAFFIGGMTREQYDRHLAEGWFRDSLSMYRSELVILDEDLYSIINIRLALDHFTLRKSQRRLMRKVESTFRVVVGPPKMTKTRERLYNLHMNRFRGFVQPNLQDLLYRSSTELIGHLEIAVYDGKKLVAVSYFDHGVSSIASLVGLFDPAYSRYSLGYYTMLREVQWAQEQGMHWYYPGYVFDRPTDFDYKLRIGKFQSLSQGYVWREGVERDPEKMITGLIRRNMVILGDFLTERGIAHTRKLYTHFAAPHLLPASSGLLDVPVYYELTDGGVTYAACYHNLKKSFLLYRIEPAYGILKNEESPPSIDYRDNPAYELRVMRVTSSSLIFPAIPDEF